MKLLLTMAFATITLTGGLANAQIVAPPAASGNELPVIELFINDQGNAQIVENARDGSFSIQPQVNNLCDAAPGSTYKVLMRGGPDYILVALNGDQIVVGDHSISWKGCPVDLGSFGFAPEMQPIVDSIMADWPLLAKAHNVGDHTGHFTSEHLKAVLTALKTEGFGIVAEQTVQTYVGADWSYFRDSALVPAVNQVYGLVVNTGSVTYLVWKPVECAALCMTAPKAVYVHHTHIHTPAPRTHVSSTRQESAAPAPRKPAILRPAPAVATTSCIRTDGTLC